MEELFFMIELFTLKYKSYPQSRTISDYFSGNILFSCPIVDNFMQINTLKAVSYPSYQFFPVPNHRRTIVNLTDTYKPAIRFFLPLLLQ